MAAFFDVPVAQGQTASKGSGPTAAQSEQMSKTQYEVVLNMTKFLSQLGEEVYARCFNADRSAVRFTMTPTPRVELDSAGDVKDLLEAGVFREFDKPKLRKRYHTDY